MIFNTLAAFIAATRNRLGFLSENFRLFVTWPIAALLLGVAGWSMLLSHLEREQRDAENRVLDQVGLLSKSYADYLAQRVAGVNQVLLHVRFEWELLGECLQLENLNKQGLFPPVSVSDVAVIDNAGTVMTRTTPGPVKNSLTHRKYFQALQQATEDFLYLGEPYYSEIVDRNVIPFARRLAGADGSFRGVVLAAIVPSYFMQSYGEAALGQHGFLGMAGSDGILRATRIGHTDYPSQAPALVVAPHFALQDENGSTLLQGNEWFDDQRPRFVGWQAVKGYPLVALTGMDRQEALAPYHDSRADALRSAQWATAALAVFTLIAMALSLRLAWRKHQSELMRFTYRVATESGTEGFYIVRPLPGPDETIDDFEVIDSNHRGAEMLRQRREELIGQRLSRLYEGANPNQLIAMLRDAMEGGCFARDVEVPSESPVAPSWVHVTIVRADDNLAVTLRDVSEAKAHVTELERRSNEDALTGLPNRHWVQAYLPRAIGHAAKRDAMLAVLFVDLDGFKAVNDTGGHAAGDELLRLTAARLKEAIRPHDHVVRLGGDEFLVIVEQIQHRDDAAAVAERVQLAFRKRFRLAQGAYAVGASIGISVFPDDGRDADTLLRNADVAMYSVKAGGKGAFHFYDQRFHDVLRNRLEYEGELRAAVEHDQFIIYYQPRIDVATGITSSMEALVRWSHPAKGLVSPLEFIPLAEETGIILGLGELVIDKVCAQLAAWAQTGQELVPVSINVSPRQFNEVDIAKLLSASLARHKVKPELVEIELTESSMMRESSGIHTTLSAIRKMGVKLLVDDFGTGYSSLSKLQQLDFDVLKVDRAFTMQVEKSEKGSVFFKAIITMAHALGMRVVAEGVENIEQIRILKSLQCDELQGYYISRPLPPSATQPILPKRFFPSTA